ncbi:MAG: DedA family protein [Candidatus Dojkabacteria bacterium]|jgi:membrane protein DedA with SNARE-associated domain
MIDFLITKSVEILVDLGYLGVFLSALGLFPTEIVIAIFAASPGSNILLISLVSSLGSLVGSIPTYIIGYIFTEDVLYKFLNGKGSFLHIDTESIDKSKKKIMKHASVYIFVTRFIPWLRVVTGIAAGYMKMNIISYCVSIFTGMFLYTLLISYLGLEAGSNWELLKEYINLLDKWVIIILFSAFLIFFLYKSKKRIMRKIRKST